MFLDNEEIGCDVGRVIKDRFLKWNRHLRVSKVLGMIHWIEKDLTEGVIKASICLCATVTECLRLGNVKWTEICWSTVLGSVKVTFREPASSQWVSPQWEAKKRRAKIPASLTLITATNTLASEEFSWLLCLQVKLPKRCTSTKFPILGSHNQLWHKRKTIWSFTTFL